MCIAVRKSGGAAPGSDLHGFAVIAIKSLTVADLQAMMLAIAMPAVVEPYA